MNACTGTGREESGARFGTQGREENCARRCRSQPLRPLPSPLHFSDAPTKEFLLSLNAARAPHAKFVVADLDDTHLLVQPGCVVELQAAVRARGDALTYLVPADPLAG